ncbi:hypothetical protein DPMN_183923 [Dreissena polymorpha]|uniref:Uncharacterized protein n=1 Tax=Dreissena polymorpha TaxID=45954 RepID=A0A9D4I5X1_DREPO|nr:hypothetical protein DPMN_183923 [Dreissena polymorpha]
MDSNSFRRRVRKVLKSMKLNVCSCHRNQEYNVSVDARPYDRNSREVADLETYEIVDINYETVNRTKACEQVDEVDKNHEDSECVTRGTEISVYNAEFVCHTTKENDAENVGDVIQDVDGEINVVCAYYGFLCPPVYTGDSLYWGTYCFCPVCLFAMVCLRQT